MDRFRVSAVTHPGFARDHNEDAYVSRPELGLWAVADGAGGHQSGEAASGLIIDALDAIPPELALEELLGQVRFHMAAAHAVLREQAARRGDGALVASTVVLLIIRDGYFACLWAGDSRAYLLRDGALSQITRDHSLVQELVDTGHITESEAEGHPRANIITRAVGAEPDILELEKVTGRLASGDRFMLCSDGLSKELADLEIADILRAEGATLAAHTLLEAALARQAGDNVTVVVVEALEDQSV